MTWDDRWNALWEDRRMWFPDALLGLTVLLVGLIEATMTGVTFGTWLELAFVVLCTAAAVGLCRRAPGIALGLVWLSCSLQVVTNIPILFVQLSIAAVAFGTARWGEPVTVVVSCVSIPIAGVIAVIVAGSDMMRSLANGIPRDIFGLHGMSPASRLATALGGSFGFASVILATAALGVPWLAGLTLRFSARAAESKNAQQVALGIAAKAQVESEQSREIARLRDEQTRLARDVHDVVGHSLAVILAQAEAAQFLPDDPADLKETMATIATSARGSLQDVRQVLSTTKEPPAQSGGLDSLIDGIRTSGNPVASTVVGAAQPLPPDLDVVAYRVLQEMLTNAINHGSRDQPVHVERHWPDPKLPHDHDLRIEVRNVIGSPDDAERNRPGGNGLIGMRRRLEAVGGRLDVRRREEPDGVTFTTTAWIPVRVG